jgi:hypothetical protein
VSKAPFRNELHTAFRLGRICVFSFEFIYRVGLNQIPIYMFQEGKRVGREHKSDQTSRDCDMPDSSIRGEGRGEKVQRRSQSARRREVDLEQVAR